MLPDEKQNERKKNVLRCLAVLASYALLLLMSRGFPVTGDDWYFASGHPPMESLFTPVAYAWKISAHHYITTNGRLLGNFLVSFASWSKILKELIRCGIILGILLCTYRLIRSGREKLNAGLFLAAFALLIALPAKVAAQSYAWAAGFFNYVPPTLLFLFYVLKLRSLFCRGDRRASPLSCLGLFLLGLCGQFFMENFTVCMCLLSLGALITDRIRSKKLHPGLLLHFLGTVIGCVIMFRAPGYGNVGVEHYRELPQDLSQVLAVIQKNFHTVSGFLTTGNLLVVILLSGSAALLCLRAYAKAEGRGKWLLSGAVTAFFCCPMFFYAQGVFGRYVFLLDLGSCVLWIMAMLVTALLALKKESAFVVLLCVGCLVLFLSPLMVVTPVGSRNAYFFNVLLILLTLTFLREWLEGVKLLRPVSFAACLACCLLLFGNFWIYHKNGQGEALRNRIIQAGMEQKETTITLPLFPYESYVHGSYGEAINACYYYQKPGDISFQFVSYNTWQDTHPSD